MMRFVLGILAFTGFLGKNVTPASGIAADPLQAQRDGAIAATLRYRDAWRANDAALVMATLTSDAVLLPGGLEPIVGDKAIRAFWWPADGPSTTVVSMDQVVDDVIADGGVAVVRGHGALRFELAQAGKSESRSVRHTFLNVVRRQADGSWLIAQRMWSDLH
jgi:uncharacterized protein (TIGR02246 family)